MMSEMGLRQIARQRDKLEIDILKLVKEFEAATRLVVDEISLAHATGPDDNEFVVGVRIKACLTETKYLPLEIDLEGAKYWSERLP
jgi:hypothetical protein